MALVEWIQKFEYLYQKVLFLLLIPLLLVFFGGLAWALLWGLPRAVLTAPAAKTRREGAILLMVSAAALGLSTAMMAWLPMASPIAAKFGKLALILAVGGAYGVCEGLCAVLLRRYGIGLWLAMLGVMGWVVVQGVRVFT